MVRFERSALNDALRDAADLARSGKRVAVVVDGAPERICEGFLRGLQEAAGARMTIAMPPLFWAAYFNAKEGGDGDLDPNAVVEIMTPRAYDNTWSESGYDEVIRADFPAS